MSSYDLPCSYLLSVKDMSSQAHVDFVIRGIQSCAVADTQVMDLWAL